MLTQPPLPSSTLDQLCPRPSELGPRHSCLTARLQALSKSATQNRLTSDGAHTGPVRLGVDGPASTFSCTCSLAAACVSSVGPPEAPNSVSCGAVNEVCGGASS